MINKHDKANKFVNSITSEKSAKGGKIKLNRTNPTDGRSDAVKGGINMTEKAPTRSYVHEIGHNVELNSPRIKKRAKEFLERRTRGEKVQKLSDITGNPKWESYEVVKPDKFKEPYMGRIYPSGDTEIVSMGVEWLDKDPVGFATQDPDYFTWLINTLRGTE